MGLLSTEVEVLLQGINIKYYENLGYEIPRTKTKYGLCVPKGTKIKVKTEDLSYGSSVTVDVNCDLCGKKYKEKYRDYYKHNHDGKCYCHACANKLFNSGELNYNWNFNKTVEERINGRQNEEYINFTKRVLCRDKYTCKCCNKNISGKMEVHHLDGYNWCVEKRLDDENAITLCSKCHSNFHSIYGYGNNTKQQFNEWIGYILTQPDTYKGELPSAKKIYDYEEDKIYDSAEQYSKIHNADLATIYRCCNHDMKVTKKILYDGTIKKRSYKTNTIKGHHILWLNEYKQMSKEDLLMYLEKCKNKVFRKIICITTQEIFDNIAEATRKYNIYGSGVRDCCTGKQKSAGRLTDDTPLQWMYYEDYYELLKNGQPIYIEIKNNKKKIICTTTGEIFDSIKYGADKYYLKNPSNITVVCNGKKKSAGKLSDGTKLQWMYYEDFLKLSQEEQNEILSRNKRVI